MSSKDYEDYQIETTKEVIDLDELENAEEVDPFQKEMLENMNESDLMFQEEIEKLEIPDDTVIVTEDKDEDDKKPKKKKFKEKIKDTMSKLKSKWNSMSKPKKAIVIIVSIIVLALIIFGITLLFKKKETPKASSVPQVIVIEDNYRYEDGILHFLDDEEDLGTYECENKDENLCYVAYLTIDDDFDETKKVDENDKNFDMRSKIYNNRYVFVYDNENEDDTFVKLYDIKDSKVIDDYQSVKAYDYNGLEDLVILTDMKNKSGMVEIGSDVDEVIPFEYEYLGILESDKNLDKIVAKKDGSYYLINSGNELLTKPYSSYVVGANEHHVKTKDELGNETVLNYQGLEVGKGDYAVLLDNYVAFVRDSKLYITDYDKNVMNLEGISVYNDYYNPVATYINRKLDNVKRSFEIEIYDKTVTLKIYKEEDDVETKTLDLHEGLLSKNLEFINYFDGKLYFYKDAKKTELLGQYACNNLNVVKDDTTELSNCMVANESFYAETTGNFKEEDLSGSLGLIPIFNERFAFIKDGENISLYDLKESSTKATYKTVDTRSYVGENKITFVNANNIYYIGESGRSGKFGLAKITPDTVEVQIEFENNSIRRLGDYYVLEQDDGYYLSDVGGGNLTIAKSGRIVDYQNNYVKTLKDGLYSVSSFKDDITSEGFDYVELYDEYYAAVKDMKLSIYKYNEEEPRIANIELELDNYDTGDVRAFKLSFDKSYVVVQVGKKDNTYVKVKEADLAKIEPPKKDEEDKDNNEESDNNQQNEEKSEE